MDELALILQKTLQPQSELERLRILRQSCGVTPVSYNGSALAGARLGDQSLSAKSLSLLGCFRNAAALSG